MNNDSQQKLFDEIILPKTLIIHDLIKGGVQENEYTDEPFQVEEDYIPFGECYIKGFPFKNQYLSYLSKLGDAFLQEVKANSYDKSIDYIGYLNDLKTEYEPLIGNSFESFQGLTYYRYFSEVVHVNFMDVDHHYKIADIKEENMQRKIHDFSIILQEIVYGIQEKLNAIYLKYITSESSDKRINCPASRDIIETYFYQLTESNKNGEQILSREQIDQLLQANFIGFGTRINKTKLNAIGLNAADIRYFVYDFITKYDVKGNKKTYAQFCIDNFDNCSGIQTITITSNFSKKPKKYFLD